MSGQAYTSLPESDERGVIALDDTPVIIRKSLDESSDGSDLIYRDNLDIEPFVDNNNEDNEKDRRFTDEGRMEDGEEDTDYMIEPRRLRPRKKSRKVLAALIGILVFAAVVGGLSAFGYSAPSYSVKSGNKPVLLDHIFNGTFTPRTKSLEWVKEAPDGTYSHTDDDGNILLSTVHNMTDQALLVNATKVVDGSGNQIYWQSWRLSPDGQYILLKTDTVKQWRHSSFANYWVHRLADGVTFPITPPSTSPTITLATWAPLGHSLAYVDENDIFVITAKELATGTPIPIQVTDDGSAVIFNGVPDWVYEEEVFEGNSALWWSPDGSTIAYLRSDETAVKEYRLQYYNPTSDAFDVHQYTTELDMKYPKPGTPNPLVTVHTFSVTEYQKSESIIMASSELVWQGSMPIQERIISEVGWVGDNALLVKEIDRAARKGSVIVFQNGETTGTVVRTLGQEGEEGDAGWIDHGQNVVPIKTPLPGYLDIVPKDGFNHIAFFTPVNATEPIWITEGLWGEVTQISAYNQTTGTVYFMAAAPSIDRHLFSAELPLYPNEVSYKQEWKALTNGNLPGYHAVSFSPGSRYYVLNYRGPEVPWQKVIEPGLAGQSSAMEILLEGNSELNATLAEFVRPLITRTTLKTDDGEFNMLEILPPNLDTSGRKKYPVLIRVYGGPGSQMVHNRFDRDWHTFLATTYKYVVVMVDGRGTGFKGRQMRNPVRDDLGHWEVVDQIAAAREMAKRRYIDNDKIGIWGWSYGGYMTCKAIEADSGIFTLGMAVAPVTNWLYYDSIYTERYMSTPSANPLGYTLSAVNNVTAFQGVPFLLAHGSGDDNVHYLNSASLVDKFTQRHVRGWRFRMFTDSNHSMDKREAFREVYAWMTDFLEEKWGRGGTIRHG